jgi:hypothetical protein
VINFNTKLKEGASFGQPITEFAPSSMGARDFRSLAREVIADEKRVAADAQALLANADRLAADAERLLATSQPLIPPDTNGTGAAGKTDHAEIEAKIDKVYGVRQARGGVAVCLHYPSANSVQLAGDFNNWDPSATSLNRAGQNGDFEGFLRLAPGRYSYRLVVDGQWMHDKDNPNVETNEFGELNSVIRVS